MANLDNILSYLGDNHFSIIEHNSPAMSITTGTIGTAWNTVTIDISETDKKPLAVWIGRHNHPANYNLLIRWAGDTNNVNVSIYRATGAAVSAPAGDFRIAVLYVDDNQS